MSMTTAMTAIEYVNTNINIANCSGYFQERHFMYFLLQRYEFLFESKKKVRVINVDYIRKNIIYVKL